MKKSTLITTIAMIVVVVVALSTATYAWFTSASAINVTTSFTTTSDADFTLTAGVGNNNAYDLSGAAKTSDTITAQTGLLSPKSAILASTMTKPTTVSSVTVAPVAMYTAKDPTNNTAILNGPVADQAPLKVYKLTKVRDNTNGLRLDIVLYASDTASNVRIRNAMASFTFVILSSVNNSGTWTDVKVQTNGYYVGGTSADTSGATATRGDYVSDASGAQSAEQKYLQNSSASAAKPSYATASTAPTAQGFADGTNYTDYGAQATDTVIHYQIDFGTIAKDYTADIAIFAWLDGWVADEDAAGAAFNAVFSFSGYAVS